MTDCSFSRMKGEAYMKKKSSGNYFILLPIVLITLLVFVPMVSGLLTSFKTGIPIDMQFSGLSNYKRMLSDTTFKKALFNTFAYLIFQVPLMLFLGLVFAQMLNDKKLKFRGFYRTALFLPSITSLVSYSLIMKSLFGQTGFVNKILLDFHLIDQAIPWLTHPVWAKVLIVIAITWRWTGYNMIFYISGLQNIDPEIYEAADIDGASKIQQFFSISIPDLKPVILFTTITSTIGTLQLFDEVQNITKGGPANSTITLSQYIYNLSYKFTPNFGYAAAVSFVIVFFIVVLSIIQKRVIKED